VTTSNHITIEECKDSKSKIVLVATPETLGDGGQATVDDLKEFNTGTTKEPCPIYVSSLLMPEQERKFLNLLSESEDVFGRSYKEMRGLDPKVTVHHLSITKGVSPKKQAQQHICQS